MTPAAPSDREGYVYVAINPAWPGKVKIGKTTNPTKRLSSYQTATPLRDFEFACAVWFPDCKLAEAILLKSLGAANEWAVCDSHFAVKAVQHLQQQTMENPSG